MGIPLQHRRGVLRRTGRIGLAVAVVLAAAPAGGAGFSRPASDQAPVVIDRLLSRPNGEIVLLSDVWQAISLRLLPEGSLTPEAALRAIENRRLILAEVNRLPATEPSEAALETRRDEWETRLAAAGVDRVAEMQRLGLTDAALQAWFRNDLRIRDYLDQRFAATPEAERPAAIEQWIGFLRQRAGLG